MSVFDNLKKLHTDLLAIKQAPSHKVNMSEIDASMDLSKTQFADPARFEGDPSKLKDVVFTDPAKTSYPDLVLDAALNISTLTKDTNGVISAGILLAKRETLMNNFKFMESSYIPKIVDEKTYQVGSALRNFLKATIADDNLLGDDSAFFTFIQSKIDIELIKDNFRKMLPILESRLRIFEATRPEKVAENNEFLRIKEEERQKWNAINNQFLADTEPHYSLLDNTNLNNPLDFTKETLNDKISQAENSITALNTLANDYLKESKAWMSAVNKITPRLPMDIFTFDNKDIKKWLGLYQNQTRLVREDIYNALNELSTFSYDHIQTARDNIKKLEALKNTLQEQVTLQSALKPYQDQLKALEVEVTPPLEAVLTDLSVSEQLVNLKNTKEILLNYQRQMKMLIPKEKAILDEATSIHPQAGEWLKEHINISAEVSDNLQIASVILQKTSEQLDALARHDRENSLREKANEIHQSFQVLRNYQMTLSNYQMALSRETALLETLSDMNEKDARSAEHVEDLRKIYLENPNPQQLTEQFNARKKGLEMQQHSLSAYQSIINNTNSTEDIDLDMLLLVLDANKEQSEELREIFAKKQTSVVGRFFSNLLGTSDNTLDNALVLSKINNKLEEVDQELAVKLDEEPAITQETDKKPHPESLYALKQAYESAMERVANLNKDIVRHEKLQAVFDKRQPSYATELKKQQAKVTQLKEEHVFAEIAYTQKRLEEKILHLEFRKLDIEDQLQAFATQPNMELFKSLSAWKTQKLPRESSFTELENEVNKLKRSLDNLWEKIPSESSSSKERQAMAKEKSGIDNKLDILLKDINGTENNKSLEERIQDVMPEMLAHVLNRYQRFDKLSDEDKKDLKADSEVLHEAMPHPLLMDVYSQKFPEKPQIEPEIAEEAQVEAIAEPSPFKRYVSVEGRFNPVFSNYLNQREAKYWVKDFIRTAAMFFSGYAYTSDSVKREDYLHDLQKMINEYQKKPDPISLSELNEKVAEGIQQFPARSENSPDSLKTLLTKLQQELPKEEVQPEQVFQL